MDGYKTCMKLVTHISVGFDDARSRVASGHRFFVLSDHEYIPWTVVCMHMYVGMCNNKCVMTGYGCITDPISFTTFFVVVVVSMCNVRI